MIQGWVRYGTQSCTLEMNSEFGRKCVENASRMQYIYVLENRVQCEQPLTACKRDGRFVSEYILVYRFATNATVIYHSCWEFVEYFYTHVHWHDVTRFNQRRAGFMMTCTRGSAVQSRKGPMLLSYAVQLRPTPFSLTPWPINTKVRIVG